MNCFIKTRILFHCVLWDLICQLEYFVSSRVFQNEKNLYSCILFLTHFFRYFFLSKNVQASEAEFTLLLIYEPGTPSTCAHRLLSVLLSREKASSLAFRKNQTTRKIRRQT